MKLKESLVNTICWRLQKSGFLTKRGPATYQRSNVGTPEELKEHFDGRHVEFHYFYLVAPRLDITFQEERAPFITNVKERYEKLQTKADSEASLEEINELVSGFPDNEIKVLKQEVLDNFTPRAIGNKIGHRYNWQGRKIYIAQSDKSIEIITGNSEKPIIDDQVISFLSFLQGLLNPYFWEHDWKLVNFAAGDDFEEIHISKDQTQIMLKDMWGNIRRWYEKKTMAVTRREVHYRPRNFSPIDLLKNLRGDSPIGILELIEHVKQLEIAMDRLNKQYNEERIKLNANTDIMIQLKCSVDNLNEALGMKVNKSFVIPFKN